MIQFKSWGAALVAAQVVLVVFGTNGYGQTPVTSPGPNPTGANEQGGELQQITVTGYIIPRVGDGPQPVISLDRNYIEKTGSQTVTEVIQNLPSAVGNFAPNTTTGFSFSPASASVRLKGLPEIIRLCWSTGGGCRLSRSIK
jgi:hypothetical protein